MIAALGAAFVSLGPVAAKQAGVPASLYSGLHWRSVGPFRAGRVDAVSGVPGRPNEFYLGSVGGGVWKTRNAGRTWKPVFDGQPVSSIGALAVANTNPDIVYVGSGESTLRDSVSYGNGVYKSTDGGQTWAHLGLDDTQHIGRVAIDPKNPDIVFVAAIGHFYGPHKDRGVFRSKDGGKTWTKVLFTDENTGAVDVVIDPANPLVVYASLWNTRRPPWFIYAPTNGPGGGIWKSIDGGTKWTQLTKGLPAEGFGRSGLAIAPSNPKRVYAVIDAKEGGLYRTDDAGATWVKASGDTRLWGRGWYFEKVAVDPKNADIVYVPNVGVQRSKDAGATWTKWAVRGSPGGDDYHQMWISPVDSNIAIVASDQGAIVTVTATDETPEWSSWVNNSIAQIYRVAPDYHFPYWLTGAQQDSGAVRVRTRGEGASLNMRDWVPACAGGESGYTAPDPLRPDILFGGTVEWCNVVTGETGNVSPERNMTEPARHAWTQPLVFSQADPRALYFANQFVYKTVDGGQNWSQISADLTREDPGVPPNLDAAAAADKAANAGKRLGVVYTLAPSPVLKPMLWAGTDDGYVQMTMDDGKTWSNVTPTPMTAWTKVTMIEASHSDYRVAYAAAERHQLEDFAPYFYRTRDAGKTWQKITTGLPAEGYAQTIKEDPKRPGLLFAGTERGVFVSFDDGDHWQSLQLNLPVTSMRDLAVKDNDLIVATHGRGFWLIDDISVLRQISDKVAAADAYLFAPSDTFNLPPGTDNGTPLQKDEPLAENAPNGAVIDYYLKTASATPVTIEILNAGGQVIRSYTSVAPAPAEPPGQTVTILWRALVESVSAGAGQHRLTWDLRPTPTGGGRGGRGGGAGGPLTGTFTVRLTANGQTYTQPMTVRPDPRR
ncbi:MAG: glycoside hydrolase [Acidobacteria bacterium]|nr:MAG: glycoside hydrolase [Acidobacteriota bacterium]